MAGEGHDRVGQARVVSGHVRQPLDLPDDVVAEPAHDAAMEGRQVGHLGR